MSGGILQLVSYGAADVNLTGNPQITYWRHVARRYSNFAIEAIPQVFHATADFGRRTSVTIARTGDLIHKMYLEVTLPIVNKNKGGNNPDDLSSDYADKRYYWVNKVGLALIKSVELEIGGIRIDRHTSEWMDAWSSLTRKEDKDNGFKYMIGDLPMAERETNKELTLYIPMMFFFNMFPGLSLPLVSIAFHEVRFNFEFRKLSELLIPPQKPGNLSEQAHLNNVLLDDTFASMQATLYADMTYLDVDERRRFSKYPHEMLVTVVQFLGDEVVPEGTDSRIIRQITLNFVHPVKELVWVYISDDKTKERDYFHYADVVQEANLLLNGQPRFTPRKGSYFRLLQPFQHHTSVPEKPVYVYSFCLHPEDPQPSGSLNFSRIDHAQLRLDTQNLPIKTPGNLNVNPPTAQVYYGGRYKVFAVSYNMMRIKGGLAGLAYSS
jgi:hypothetical protein